MSQLQKATEKILQTVNDKTITDERKYSLIKSIIRGYASKAINLVIGIETSSDIGKQRDERIKNFTSDYEIKESDNMFY